MYRFLTLAMVIVCMGVHAQKLHTISLSSEMLSARTKLNFRVVRIIDGRRDKSNIGLVQKGMSNRPTFAAFKTPISQEIMGLLSRSGVATTGPDVILRVEYLAVSEQTRATTETAKTEIAMDLFRVSGDEATFVARKIAAKESRGMEVTAKHPGNIASAIEDILLQFNAFEFFSPAEGEPTVPLSEIADYRSEPLAEVNAPILDAENYNDGLYGSFEEFRDNTPSFIDGYEVREGDPLRARWVDPDGKRTRVRDAVYALAYKNGLYIFFNGFFYPIEKYSNGLFFNGPAVPDNGAIMAGGIMGGLIGGAIAAAASAKTTRYKIDLSNGSLQAVTSRN
jgi:hypothetical protein